VVAEADEYRTPIAFEGIDHLRAPFVMPEGSEGDRNLRHGGDCVLGARPRSRRSMVRSSSASPALSPAGAILMNKSLMYSSCQRRVLRQRPRALHTAACKGRPTARRIGSIVSSVPRKQRSAAESGRLLRQLLFSAIPWDFARPPSRPNVAPA